MREYSGPCARIWAWCLALDMVQGCRQCVGLRARYWAVGPRGTLRGACLFKSSHVYLRQKEDTVVLVLPKSAFSKLPSE